MKGYLKRNYDGVKEIREGDVKPPWNLSSYKLRRTMGDVGWKYYWEWRIKWETAKIIPIHAGVYFAFPEEGEVAYELYGMLAVPKGFDKSLLIPRSNYSKSRANRKFERLLHEDGGYSARRNANDGGF